MHYWSDVNPHWMRTVDFQGQYQWSINCWGGVLGEQVIGPHFFDGRLNGAGYLAFLQNDLLPICSLTSRSPSAVTTGSNRTARCLNGCWQFVLT
ncbi:hypothetical protein FOCC_FOCC007118 [Frankliniella occidentalis]|nr:hypothetical protein FOCC_FOCC007118 [Frankliniella occidentalis]